MTRVVQAKEAQQFQLGTRQCGRSARIEELKRRICICSYTVSSGSGGHYGLQYMVPEGKVQCDGPGYSVFKERDSCVAATAAKRGPLREDKIRDTKTHAKRPL